MKTRITNFIVGSWFVLLGMAYRFLLRRGFFRPLPDPFVVPWED